MSSSGGGVIIIHNYKTNGPGAGKQAGLTELDLEVVIAHLPAGHLKQMLEALLKD